MGDDDMTTGGGMSEHTPEDIAGHRAAALHRIDPETVH